MAKISKDNLDYLLEYGLDIRNRKIHLSGDVDEEMATDCLRSLDFLSTASNEPITIILNSLGGEVDQGFAIYDAIKRCPCHITILGTGPVMSMAVIILQAGDVRAITPHTTIMTHQMSGGIEGNKKSVKNWAKWFEWAEARCNQILADRSGRTAQYWEREHQADLVLTPQKALELGVVDEIIGE